MMKSGRLIVLALLFVLVVVLGSQVRAGEQAIQLSLFTPIQIHPEGEIVSGFRFNLLYGRQATVVGLDLGLVNHTTTGLSKGVQWGLVNYTDASFLGMQHGMVNVTMKDFEGFQWGFVNYAHKANGFQLGFVNYAHTLHGLQIGLVNIIKQGGQFPVFPFVNWSF